MHLRRLARRVRKEIGAFLVGRDGVSAIEFSFVAIPFFFLLFAILETGYVFLIAIVLEGAAADGARQIRTGVVQQDANPTGAFDTLVCNGMLSLLNCSRLNFDARNFADFASITSAAPPTTKGTTFSTGTPGNIVVVRVALTWTYMTPFLRSALVAAGGTGNTELIASVVVQTEQYL